MSEEDDWEVIMSPLCQVYKSNGKSVQIDIYNGDYGGWIIEVVDQYDNATVWNDEYPTDQAALDDAIKTIKEDGIAAFIGQPSKNLH